MRDDEKIKGAFITMKRQACAVLLGAALLLGSQSAWAQEATYVFSYEGFRYTQRENETVLTQTNLDEHEDLAP